MFEFLHAADLHLDSAMHGVVRYDGLPVERLRRATRGALEALVDLALRRRVAFVLLAGDLFDHECEDFNTPLFFRAQLERLARAGIRVLVVQGNHDAADHSMGRAYALDLPAGVTLFPVEAPTSVELSDLRVVVHGQGYRTRDVTENLARAYPARRPGWFNVGLLHANVHESGSAHRDYAPCTVADLAERGYDYWALGHVHQRWARRAGDAWIVYPGNLQGRHARETGPKGCTLVTVDHGAVTEVAHVPLDVVRWERLEVDASALEVDAPEALVSAVVEQVAQAQADAGRFLVARVVVRGATPAHDALVAGGRRWEDALRLGVVRRCPGAAALEKVLLETAPPPAAAEHDAEAAAALGELLAHLDGPLLEEAYAAVRDEIARAVDQIPSDPRDEQGDGALSFADEAQRRALLHDVEAFLRAALRGPDLAGPGGA